MLYVPCGSEDEAARIARTLLSERLVACGNIYPSRSLYEWKGEVVDEEEFLLLLKTAPTRAVAAEKRVRELHTFELPCIVRIEPENVNYDYAAWVAGQIGGRQVSAAAGKATAIAPEQAESDRT